MFTKGSIRILLPASTESFVDEEPPEVQYLGVTGSHVNAQRPCEPTLFERMGAPTDLVEWAKWYAADRKRRGIPNHPESSRRVRQRTP